MNNAEYIIAVIDRANEEGTISWRTSTRVLKEVAGLLNSGMSAAEINQSPPMLKLWKEVGKKWGGR